MSSKVRVRVWVVAEGGGQEEIQGEQVLIAVVVVLLEEVVVVVVRVVEVVLVSEEEVVVMFVYGRVMVLDVVDVAVEFGDVGPVLGGQAVASLYTVVVTVTDGTLMVLVTVGGKNVV